MYIYIYIYTHTHTHTHTQTHTYVCVYVCIYSDYPLFVCFLRKFRDALHKNYFQVLEHHNDDDLNVHSTICEWGKAIKSDFDTTNAPLKLRHGQPDQA